MLQLGAHKHSVKYLNCLVIGVADGKKMKKAILSARWASPGSEIRNLIFVKPKAEIYIGVFRMWNSLYVNSTALGLR